MEAIGRRLQAPTAAPRVQTAMIGKQMQSAAQQLFEIDEAADRLFRPYTDSVPVRALGIISKLGDQPELRVLACSLLVAGTFAGSDRLVRAGARMILAHEAATAAKDVIKGEIDRTRPRSADARDKKKPKAGNHTAKEKTSFPSGHSAGAIAAARAFSREYPEYGPAAIGAAALIAAAQVPRCAHYPTDVAAGIGIGLLAEAAINALWNAADMDERSSE